MKKLIALILISTLFSSCFKEKYNQSQKTIDSLVYENKILKNRISDYEFLELKRNQTKYVWTVIYFKSGNYVSGWSPKKGHYEGFEGKFTDKVYYSDVKTINNFNNSIKYELQDNLEKDLRNYYRQNVKSILKRETFVFNTYEKASEHRYNFIN